MAAWFDQQSFVERYSPFGMSALAVTSSDPQADHCCSPGPGVMQNMQGVNQDNALMNPDGTITGLGSWVSASVRPYRRARLKALSPFRSTSARRRPISARNGHALDPTSRLPHVSTPACSFFPLPYAFGCINLACSWRSWSSLADANACPHVKCSHCLRIVNKQAPRVSRMAGLPLTGGPCSHCQAPSHTSIYSTLLT